MQPPKLGLSPNHGRVEPAGEARLGPHRDQAERGHRLRLALQHQRLDLLDIDGSSGQPQRLLCDQDLTGPGGLLQTRSDVHRVAGGQALLGSGHDLPGGHADASLHAELGEGATHLNGRA